MTTPESTAAVVVEARDRATATMNKITAGLNRMQTQAASTGVSMARLSGQGGALASGLAQVGTAFGPASLAFTGLGIGIGFATQKITELVRESREASKAARDLENNLVLTGFSAISADSAVGEMRNQMNRTAFQTLPKLSLEMQRLFGTMDQDSREQVGAMTEVLTDIGLDPVDSMNALLNAVEGNFGPISRLIGEPINNLDEFAAAMERLAIEGDISGNEFLLTLARVAQGVREGSITVEEAGTQLRDSIRTNYGDASAAVTENTDIIKTLLEGLTESERQALADSTEFTHLRFKKEADLSKDLATIFKSIRTQRGADSLNEGIHTNISAGFIQARINKIREVDPALADELEKWLKVYEDDQEALNTLAGIAEDALLRVKDAAANNSPDTVAYLKDIELAADAARRALERLAAAQGSSSGGSSRVPTATPRPVPPIQQRGSVSQGGPNRNRRGFQVGGIIRTPTEAIVGEVPELIAPLERLPDLFQQMVPHSNRPIYLTIQVGDRVLKDIIIETLDEEVAIREPNLGLG